MLALSSIHTAYLRPAEAETYELLATHHRSLALPPYREALTSITESNCHPLYACSHLVTKCAFASPQMRLNMVLSPSVGTASEFINLLRGAFSIHNFAFEWLSNGPLGFCLEKPLNTNPDLDLNPDDFRLARLLHVLLIDDSGEISICCGALNSFRNCLQWPLHLIRLFPPRPLLSRGQYRS